ALLRSRGSEPIWRGVTRRAARPVRSGGARGAEQAVARRASGVREDAAGPSRGAQCDAAATSGPRTEGTGRSAHRFPCEAGAAPGHARRWRYPAGAGGVVTLGPFPCRSRRNYDRVELRSLLEAGNSLVDGIAVVIQLAPWGSASEIST